MPVTKDGRNLFIHIPKCAGTSIEVALGIAGNYPDIGLKPTKTKYDLTALFGGGLQHLSAREIIEYYHDKWKKINISFSIIRCPVSRFISYYTWKHYRFAECDYSDRDILLSLGDHLSYCVEFCNKNEIFRYPYEGLEYCEGSNSGVRINSVDRHLIPQCSYVSYKDHLVIDHLINMNLLEGANFVLDELGINAGHLEKRMCNKLTARVKNLLPRKWESKINDMYCFDRHLHNSLSGKVHSQKETIKLMKQPKNFYKKQINRVKKYTFLERRRHSPVPRKLWMYWHQGWTDAPYMILKCKNSWIANNPTWEINLLDNKTITDFVKLPAFYDEMNLTLASFSDILRMHLLSKYGGVWADATTFCTRNLDDWINEVTRYSGFFAYDKPGPMRPLASWFLASEEKGYISSTYKENINNLWRRVDRDGAKILNELFSIANAGQAGKFLKKINESSHGNFRNISTNSWEGELNSNSSSKFYFWVHRLFMVLLMHDKKFEKLWRQTPKLSADNPHFLQHRGLLEPLTDEIKIHINNKFTNVYKLNRRIELPLRMDDTVIGYLLK